MEIWKDVIGYEGLYEVSNFGRVKSLLLKNERILRPRINGNGYLRVALRKNDIAKDFFIHRLVAFSFLENMEEKEFINHIDGNKKNNTVENLEWCNRSENIQHAIKNGLMDNIFGEKNKNSKITKEQALKIKYGHHGISNTELASIYKINQSKISEIRSGKRWKYI